ncbi:unnamed protein product [Alternaria alternata]|nr:hypothetical protein B0T12DRAFT_451797 [Alternaria alternata]OWY42822.1 ferric-chelate reductase [Alternaria alternata]RYN67061.1 hypothetical protein AA0118_g2316 [Alternaria tenuissima]
MAELLDLCYDVLIRILEELHPADLAACAQTSKGFNEFLKKNKPLYKTLYLKHFDDPRRRRPTDPEPEWVGALQRVVRCQKVLESANNDLKKDEFTFVATTVSELIATMARDEYGITRNQRFVTDLFQHIEQNHNAFLCRSSIFGRTRSAKRKSAEDEESRQLSARLHSLFGFPPSNAGKIDLSMNTLARTRVYDLRNYTDKNEWGPFRNDRTWRVDWEMIESIMIVIGHNSCFCAHAVSNRLRPPWFGPLDGVIPVANGRIGHEVSNYTALIQQPDIPLRMKDPYGAEGIWARIVCFLDYNDLYNYNFSSDAIKVPSDEPRGALDTDEAIRHIVMDLRVTDVTAPGPFDNPTLPIVHFKGVAKSVDALWDPNANSGIRGTVRLTQEGEVRWETISVFQGGEERWRSDGIQVGGLRCPRGVVGTWFDKDFDLHGPAGPTAFWKVGERPADSEDEESDSEDGLWGTA